MSQKILSQKVFVIINHCTFLRILEVLGYLVCFVPNLSNVTEFYCFFCKNIILRVPIDWCVLNWVVFSQFYKIQKRSVNVLNKCSSYKNSAILMVGIKWLYQLWVELSPIHEHRIKHNFNDTLCVTFVNAQKTLNIFSYTAHVLQKLEVLY